MIAVGVGTLRRYYRLKAEAAEQREERAVAAVFQEKREATPGTPLPEDFPHRERLVVLGYQTLEDLRGATEDELVGRGLTRRQAAKVLAALTG